MHNLTAREVILGVSTRAAAVRGVLAWLRQASRVRGCCLLGRWGALQCDTPPALSHDCPAGQGALCALLTHASRFSSREKQLGQGRWMLLILLWRWGTLHLVCLGPTFYTELQKLTGCCMPSRPCNPCPLNPCLPRQQKLGVSHSCNRFFLGPSPLLCWPLQGINGDRIGTGSHHPMCPGEGSAQHLYPAGWCEALAGQGTVCKIS